jgi:hypothetical protein
MLFLLSSPLQAGAIELILETMTVAWILKKENGRLPRGPRIDPMAVYAADDIELLPLP